MKRLSVLLGRPFAAPDIELLTKSCQDFADFIKPEAYTPEALLPHAPMVDAYFGENASSDFLAKAENLKLIQVPWTGLDRVDFSSLAPYPDIAFCNSHSNALDVAEQAVTLLLSALRTIPAHHESMKRGQWRRPGSPEFIPPLRLSNEPVLYVGFGAINQAVHSLLKGFNCRTRLITRSGAQAADAEAWGTPEQILELAAGCRAAVIATPLTGQTRGLINREVMKALGSQACLVNVARGEVVMEADLYAALSTGELGSAGIDTWWKGPPGGPAPLYPSHLPFERLSNLVMSPHRGGFAAGVMPHLDDAVENVRRLAYGEPLINVVDRSRGY